MSIRSEYGVLQTTEFKVGEHLLVGTRGSQCAGAVFLPYLMDFEQGLFFCFRLDLETLDPKLASTLKTLSSDKKFKKQKPTIEGGPTEPDKRFILTRSDWEPDNNKSLEFGNYRLHICMPALQKVADGQGPDDFLFIQGYSAFQLNTLTDHLKCGDWVLSPALPEIVFTKQRQSIANMALAAAEDKIGVHDSAALA